MLMAASLLAANVEMMMTAIIMEDSNDADDGQVSGGGSYAEAGTYIREYERLLHLDYFGDAHCSWADAACGVCRGHAQLCPLDG